MKRKLFMKLGAVATAATMLFTMAACTNGNVNPERNGGTINVRVCLAGYGSDYVYALKEHFEETFADEGYKVNVLIPTTDMAGDIVMQDMYSKDDWADVYFTSNMIISRYVNGEYGQLVADITDSVWKQKPIKFDGTTEDKTVEEKFALNVDDDLCKVDGKRYSFYSNHSVRGMIVNLDKLSRYGCEIPLTTDQMFDTFDKILNGTTVDGQRVLGSQSTGIFPMTYLSGNNGYPLAMVHTLFAQYVGIEEYNRFFAFENANGTNCDTAYEMFNPETVTGKGLAEMFETVYKAYDSKYTAPGSANSTIATAHNRIMTSKSGAVFMCDGDWAYNECLADYKSSIENLGFMNIPVTSALGVKLFGAGTAYGKDDATADEMLAYVIKGVDEGKTAAEISTASASESFGKINEAEAERIAEARGVYLSGAVGGGNVLVCNKTENLDICSLFLRMFASNDYAAEFTKSANAFTPFDENFNTTGNGFAESFKSIVSTDNAYGLQDRPTGFRAKLGQNTLLPKGGMYIVTSMINENVTEANYASAAESKIKEEYEFAKSKWQTWLSDAGL